MGYLVMGWLVLIAAVPLIERAPQPGLSLLVAGGLAYTAGVVFFLLDSRLRYAHAVWHGFVVAGTGCHFFAVLGYAGRGWAEVGRPARGAAGASRDGRASVRARARP